MESTELILNATEIAALEGTLANEYGVDMDDVVIEATYTVTGSVDFDDLPEDVSIAELEDILQENIADALGVHAKHVNVAVTPTGEITYVVTSSGDVSASNIQDIMGSTSFLENLNDEMSEDIPDVHVGSVSVNEEIEMVLIVTVDASESTMDIEEVNEQIIEEFENQGVLGNSDSTFETFFNHHLRFWISIW